MCYYHWETLYLILSGPKTLAIFSSWMKNCWFSSHSDLFFLRSYPFFCILNENKEIRFERQFQRKKYDLNRATFICKPVDWYTSVSLSDQLIFQSINPKFNTQFFIDSSCWVVAEYMSSTPKWYGTLDLTETNSCVVDVFIDGLLM